MSAPAATAASRSSAQRAPSLPPPLHAQRRPCCDRRQHADVHAGNGHQVTGSAAGQRAPLLPAERILQAHRQACDDPCRGPIAERDADGLVDRAACDEDRPPQHVAPASSLPARRPHVASGTDALPQQARLLVHAARVREPARSAQAHVEFEPLGGQRLPFGFVPGELDMRRHSGRWISREPEAHAAGARLRHGRDCTANRHRTPLEQRLEPIVQPCRCVPPARGESERKRQDRPGTQGKRRHRGQRDSSRNDRAAGQLCQRQQRAAAREECTSRQNHHHLRAVRRHRQTARRIAGLRPANPAASWRFRPGRGVRRAA